MGFSLVGERCLAIAWAALSKKRASRSEASAGAWSEGSGAGCSRAKG